MIKLYENEKEWERKVKLKDTVCGIRLFRHDETYTLTIWLASKQFHTRCEIEVGHRGLKRLFCGV